MKDATILRIGNFTVFFSFLLGTVIFLTFVITEDQNLFLFGYYFIIIAAIVNLVVLFWLLFQTSIEKSIRRRLNRSRLLLVANIPIAILYFYGVMTLLSYMRITFVNKTESTITNIRIIGCESKSIDQLSPNGKSTKWIEINGDCSIEIKYLKDQNHSRANSFTNPRQ